LDISETEYEDTTKQVQVEKSSAGGRVKTTVEENLTVSAFKYRTMTTIGATNGMPAIFFNYDISPLRIHYTVSYTPISEFLVHLCAIIGGFYAVTGIVESLLRNTAKAVLQDEKAKTGEATRAEEDEQTHESNGPTVQARMSNGPTMVPQ